MKRLVLTADDFGLSEAVNEGVERAHRAGVLTAASLMVAGAAAADAVRRAQAMPGLRVGLHLVIVEGPGVAGWQGFGQLRLGVRYALPSRSLAAEIRAQFAAFAATGLMLDHANAHKHMHLHPVVGRLMLSIGREFGLRAVRLPCEPVSVMACCGEEPRMAGRAMEAWSAVLRRQAWGAGMLLNDAVFGLRWTGGMTEERLLRLIPCLPRGLSEIYFHPASRRDPLLERLMPRYRHEAELDALLSPRVREALAGVTLGGFQDFA